MANFTSILTGKQVESLLVNYATCTTAGGTAAKVATISSINGTTPQFELFTGLTVRVKFTNSNTAADPTLNVNNTGAKAIKKYGTTAPGITSTTSWSAGAIVSLTYDGSYWVMNDIKDEQYTGDITSITAGNGLTDGGTSGDVTLNVGAGNGIEVSANAVSAKAGSGITVDTNGINANTSFTTSGKNYKVQVDSTSGGLFVNVPWTDTNTDTDTHYTNYLQITGNGTEAVKFTQNADKSLNLKPGTNVSISATSGEITINATDTNTWRGIQDNLTSTSTSDSLSANQGKVLKGLVDGKLSTSGGTISGNLAVTGTTSSTGLITQGAPSSDSTITSMNRFAADLFISGNGSAPNNPKVAGFYLGKSAADENRHMDIVSGGDYSYIDFNNASNVNDYQARCLVNVNTGNIDWQWDGAATDKTFNVSGVLKQYGVPVALSNHAHDYSGTAAASADKVNVVTGVEANGTATALTGVKVSSSLSAAPGGHTHSYDKTTGVSLTANDSTATGRITYVESISFTGASASGTANAGSETHTHSYTKPTGVSLGSNSTASGGVAYVSSVSGSAPSLTGTKTFVTGVTQGSGGLSSNDTASGGLRYVYGQGTFNAGTTPISNVNVSLSLVDNGKTVIQGSLSGTTLTLTTVKVAPAEHDHDVSITRGTAPSLGSPTYKYLHHTHTSASSAGTGTVGISGGSYSATTKYFHPSITTESANTGTPSATTQFVTGVLGGTASATTKYLSAAPSNTSTNTSANSGTNFNAATAVSSNGTADVLTGVKATGTASVSSGDHTHEYSGTTGTPK